MKENCLDIGIIQAFLDGELVQDRSARVSRHIADCERCAVMLAEAEDESAIVFSALEREINTLVPTQRLWNRINDSIATERDSRPFWQKAWAFLAVALANPALAASASLLIVIGIFAAVWIIRTEVPADVAVNETQSKPISAGLNTTAAPPSNLTAGNQETTPESDTRIERAAYRTKNKAISTVPAILSTNSNGYMPGEESYVRTISSLTKTVEEQKNGGIMRPGQRIAYERDLAVVNDAIAKMKKEVKRNPRNESAKQVLYSSYQNKIDLLNSVSQKEDLLVSLK